MSLAIDDGRSSLAFGLWSLAETTSAAALWATALGVSGAGDRTRTGDVQLGKLAFYQLNYARNAGLTDEPEYTRPATTFATDEPAAAAVP